MKAPQRALLCRGRLVMLAAAALLPTLAAAQVPAEDLWVFEPTGTGTGDPGTGPREYYEKHVTDDVGSIEIELRRIGGTGSGWVEIRALDESTAQPFVHYSLLTPTKHYASWRQSMKFTLNILQRPGWFRQRWLWLEIIDPELPDGMVGQRLLLGIRPAEGNSPPEIAFDMATSDVSAGGSVAIGVHLDQPSEEEVVLHYTSHQDPETDPLQFSVPESGTIVIPPTQVAAEIVVSTDLFATSGSTLVLDLDYENADGSDVNQFFGTHSWTHTKTNALNVDGTISFSDPQDEDQGFMLGGPCDHGYETDVVRPQDPTLFHFDGSDEPILGVVMADDVSDRAYVRADTELATPGVDGPNSLVRMGSYQEVMVHFGQFTGADAWRNSNRYKVVLRARTANIGHELIINRDSTQGGEDSETFWIEGTPWTVTPNRLYIVDDDPEAIDDEFFMTSVDYGDEVKRPVLVFRHVTVRDYNYGGSCKTPNECGDGCGFECEEDRANVLIYPYRFTQDLGCDTPEPQAIGYGTLLYGISYRTMDEPPLWGTVPKFWERRGLWPEPRGGARISGGPIRHTVTIE